MIRIAAKHLRIDCQRSARWQRGRAILHLGEAMGKGNVGLALAVSRDVPVEHAEMLLSAGPADHDGADAIISWLSHIPAEGSGQCRTEPN